MNWLAAYFYGGGRRRLGGATSFLRQSLPGSPATSGSSNLPAFPAPPSAGGRHVHPLPLPPPPGHGGALVQPGPALRGRERAAAAGAAAPGLAAEHRREG